MADEDVQDWREALGDDLREHPSLRDITTPEAAAKTIIGAQEYMGRSVSIPTDDAGEEQRNAFYEKLTKVPGVARLPDPDDEDGFLGLATKLGRPEDPKGYEFERPELPEGASYDEAVDDWFRGTAHKLGLTKRQAETMHREFNQLMLESYQQQHASTERAAQALAKEWGDDVDQHMGNISNLIESVIEDPQERAALKDEMKAVNVHNSPRLTKLLDKLAFMTLEDHMVHGAQPAEQTFADLQQRATELQMQLSNMPSHDPRREGLLTRYERTMRELTALRERAA